jgi:hypothetical protein
MFHTLPAHFPLHNAENNTCQLHHFSYTSGSLPSPQCGEQYLSAPSKWWGSILGLNNILWRNKKGIIEFRWRWLGLSRRGDIHLSVVRWIRTNRGDCWWSAVNKNLMTLGDMEIRKRFRRGPGVISQELTSIRSTIAPSNFACSTQAQVHLSSRCATLHTKEVDRVRLGSGRGLWPGARYVLLRKC